MKTYSAEIGGKRFVVRAANKQQAKEEIRKLHRLVFEEDLPDGVKITEE